MQNNQTQYGEKEILTDALSTEKFLTANYNTLANECADPALKRALLDLLNDEHDIQYDVFCEMHSRGYYPTPLADAQKVQQSKQKFSNVN